MPVEMWKIHGPTRVSGVRFWMRRKTRGFARCTRLTPYSTQRIVDVGVLVTVAAGPVVTVGKPERFLRRLFQALWKSSRRNCRRLPLLISTAAAVSTGFSFFWFFFFFFLMSFPCGKPGRVALRILNPTGSTVKPDFRTRSARRAGHMLR